MSQFISWIIARVQQSQMRQQQPRMTRKERNLAMPPQTRWWSTILDGEHRGDPCASIYNTT